MKGKGWPTVSFGALNATFSYIISFEMLPTFLSSLKIWLGLAGLIFLDRFGLVRVFKFLTLLVLFCSSSCWLDIIVFFTFLCFLLSSNELEVELGLDFTISSLNLKVLTLVVSFLSGWIKVHLCWRTLSLCPEGWVV